MKGYGINIDEYKYNIVLNDNVISLKVRNNKYSCNEEFIDFNIVVDNTIEKTTYYPHKKTIVVNSLQVFCMGLLTKDKKLINHLFTIYYYELKKQLNNLKK